jgi:hypothetical protein
MHGYQRSSATPLSLPPGPAQAGSGAISGFDNFHRSADGKAGHIAGSGRNRPTESRDQLLDIHRADHELRIAPRVPRTADTGLHGATAGTSGSRSPSQPFF